MLTGEPVTGPSKPLSLRAYARRRGSSVQSVLRAIGRGRLKDSLVYVDGVAQVADADLADREWTERTDLTKAPGYLKERVGSAPGAPLPAPGDPPAGAAPVPGETTDDDVSLAEASRREKFWKAQMAELEYRREAGKLVPAADVAQAWSEIAVIVRTKILGVPGRVKSQHPAMELAYVATMDARLREALDALADGADWRRRRGTRTS